MTDKCAYCDSTDGLEWHHILPRSLGGPAEAFNLIRVCNVHHAILHDLSSRGNISELIKIGLEKARAKGVRMGVGHVIDPDTLERICAEKPQTTLDVLAEKYNLSRATIGRNIAIWKDRLAEYREQFHAKQLQHASLR